MSYDLVLTGSPPTVHALGCPSVDFLRALGVPMATLLGCKSAPPDTLERHDCFQDPE